MPATQRPSSDVTSSTKFSSDGFDLDALAVSAPNSDDDVVYELDGTVSALKEHKNNNNNQSNSETATSKSAKETPTTTASDINDNENDPLMLSEQYKKEGNDFFIKHMWSEALDCYTKAIDSVPYDSTNLVYTGEELLQLQSEWEVEQNRLARQKLQERDEQERQNRLQQKDQERRNHQQQQKEDEIIHDVNDEEEMKQQKQDSTTIENSEQFNVPYHPFSTSLSVYHCNRAAAFLQLEQEKQQQKQPSSSAVHSASSSTPWKPNQDVSDNEDEYNYDADGQTSSKKKNKQIEAAIRDCTIAILLQSNYSKALLRRATAYERNDKTDRALDDTKQALEILERTKGQNQAQLKTVQSNVIRLQKIEDERLEKLKAETLSKLKDLGNSILGNFGLSLDSFQAKQDPNTGSYSISFNNNK